MPNIRVIGGVGVVFAALLGVWWFNKDSVPVEPSGPFYAKGDAGVSLDVDVQTLVRNNLAKIIGPETQIPCRMHAFGTVTTRAPLKSMPSGAPSASDCYNCLGWAVWERKHLELPRKNFTDNIAAMQTEIKSFLLLHNNITLKSFALGAKEFPEFDINASIDLSVDDMHNNIMAFYFGDGLWTHTARYLREVPNRPDIRGWTSKMNYDALVLHDHTDNLSNVYGEVKIYATPEIT